MKLSHLLGAAAIGALMAGALPAIAQSGYPERPVTIIVPFAAGGGTDAVARIVAAGLQERLGQQFNVQNLPGAGGFIGHQAIADAAPDGYTIGFMSSSVDGYKPLGRGDLNYESFTPLALVNFDAAGVQVRHDSEFETIEEAIAAIQANPERFTASASGIGGPWHLAWVQLMMAIGSGPDEVVFVPSGGASPSLNELIAGGVDFAPTSVAEARSLIEAGEVRSLAVMDSARMEAFPDLPTIEESLGLAVSAGVWRGFAGPLDMPQDATDTLIEHIEAIYESESFQARLADLSFGTRWAAGDDFRTFMQDAHESTVAVMEAAGLTE